MKYLLFSIFIFSVAALNSSCAQNKKFSASSEINQLISKSNEILPGATQLNEYAKLIGSARVAVFANPTSTIGSSHLVDTLLSRKINVVKIFGPEHGFRGTADAGEKVGNEIDKKTGIPVISLYGKHRAPDENDLKDVDFMIFDIQDVGVRFYTYISSLQEYIQAAVKYQKKLIILDRPNPNGFYVDGPILDTANKSFIGMQPVPIVYGLTMAEYALMLIGEKWLEKPIADIALNFNDGNQYAKSGNFELYIFKNINYDHNSLYQLPVAPSPNLPEMQSIYLYPSTCFFEGTIFSEGRGTDKPFQIFGHPKMPNNLFAFTPKPNFGAKSSKNFNQVNYGWNLHASNEKILMDLNKKINLNYFINAYKLFPGKDSFFLKNNFINKLSGYKEFQQQIKNGWTEDKIRKSWEPKLSDFKKLRKKYLLYKDFE